MQTTVTAALGDRIPGTAALSEMLRRRRATGGPAEQTFATLVGLELRPRKMREAAELWERLTEAAGVDGRDAVWQHPDLLAGGFRPGRAGRVHRPGDRWRHQRHRRSDRQSGKGRPAGLTAAIPTLNTGRRQAGSRRVTVKPIASEYKLHELDWIDTNRRKVEEATKGRVGYVFLPDMEDVGLNEFFKQWFPQVRKEGMIIDVRYNGGGFVDQIIFERLRRMVLAMGTSRNFGSAPNPDPAFYGSMAAITNEYAASDGDFFTYYFKLYRLGPVIGMRTWGGVRGIRGNIPLMDGGYVTRPEFSLYGMDSQWVIENKGVQPDIVIDNTPDQVMAGRDPQLEKAIEVVLKEMQEHPKTLPPRPADLPAYPTKPGQ